MHFIENKRFSHLFNLCTERIYCSIFSRISVFPPHFPHGLSDQCRFLVCTASAFAAIIAGKRFPVSGTCVLAFPLRDFFYIGQGKQEAGCFFIPMDSRPRSRISDLSDSPSSRPLNSRARLEGWLHRQWSRISAFSLVLSPLSFLFLCISRSRALRASPETLPVPVLVVGNIYVGGTGKTPVTIALVRGLSERGWVPGVISRGYGRKDDPAMLVNAESAAEKSGDEPLLIAKKTGVPVAVGRNRTEAAKLLLKAHPEVNLIISDDGLQHYALARDAELCVVGARGIGNGWVLPAGPLREPPSRLDTVDAIILNTTEETLDTRTPRFATSAMLTECRRISDGKVLSVDELRDQHAGRKIAAAAGIAVPGRFFAMLRGRGIICSETSELGDHFGFDENPFASMQADVILITEKDAVKCRQNPEILADSRIWVVGYDIALEPYLFDFIGRKIQERRPQAASAAKETLHAA